MTALADVDHQHPGTGSMGVEADVLPFQAKTVVAFYRIHIYWLLRVSASTRCWKHDFWRVWDAKTSKKLVSIHVFSAGECHDQAWELGVVGTQEQKANQHARHRDKLLILFMWKLAVCCKLRQWSQLLQSAAI